MQNYALLRRAGHTHKPVMLKRGLAATIEELLMSAEYIMSEGNSQVILCERGIRTFADNTRNTLDISAIPCIQEVSHLPVVVDPSHAAGKREYVIPLSRAALAVGAQGLIVEVHHEPARAVSDGRQSLDPEGFRELMREVNRLKI
jgi:3-deoxy-7-phosphoheptulonate synthase